jgi:type VI protein secretion system component Hcp
MADEGSDLFLQIFRSKSSGQSGKPGGSTGSSSSALSSGLDAIEGETQDSAMVGRGIEINDFNFEFGKPTTKSSADLSTLFNEKGQLDKKGFEAVLKQTTEKDGKGKGNAGEDADSTDKPSLSVTKYVDLSTPDLLKAYNDTCSIKSPYFETVMITSYRAGGEQIPYLRVIFGSVRLVSYKLQMSSPLPKEDLEFEFLQCKIEYWPQTTTGAVGEGNKYGWDFDKKKEWRKVMPMASSR